MKLLDTNVLLRWLLADQKHQTEAVGKYLKNAFAKEEGLFVSDLAIAEMVWVMEGQEITPSVIARVMRVALHEGRIQFENRDRLLTALTLYETHEVDYIDAYQASLVQEQQMEAVISFDKDFDHLPVRRVEP